MGAALNGGKIYGELPDLSLNSNQDLGDGRMIPSLSIEQYIASIATWFGLSATQLLEVFPNAARFDLQNVQLFDGLG